MLVSLETFSTFSLLGLIWTIQLVHYPSFRYVSNSKFTEFTTFHARSISFIVLPLMIIELVVAIGLSFLLQDSFSYIKLALVLCIWGSTFALSVPRHNQLQKRRDEKVIESLILTNWPRTILWSVKSLLVYLTLI